MRWPSTIPAGVVSREIVTSLDFLPTLARLAGAEPPADRIIDGLDIAAVMTAQPGATSPRDAFFYYLGDRLQAVRRGPWKLHVWRDGMALCELYNLDEDLGETRNVAAGHPDIVADLGARAEAMRQEIGDAATGAAGRNCRPAGRVANPKPLTQFDPAHPYYMAMYDLPDRG
jgi:arylsulfatase A-like enzyme